MTEPTVLLSLHADDLGLSSAVTEGICDAVRRGLLTGASVLANAPGTVAALGAWRRLEAARRDGNLPSRRARDLLGDPRRPFDLGVHLNLSQGRPLTGESFPPALLDGEGAFQGIATFVRLMGPGAARHAPAVHRELAAQIEFVLDHAVHPVRLDGHQYCELCPLVGGIVVDLARRYAIASVRVALEPGVMRTLLRRRAPRAASAVAGGATRLLAGAFARRARRAGVQRTCCFFGTATAGRVRLEDLDRFLTVAARRGARHVEVGLHPALPAAVADGGDPRADCHPWRDPLAAERPDEHRWLIDEGLPAWLVRRGVRLGRVG